jgi:hypothetical protein
MAFREDIDAALPAEHVLKQVRAFLDECGWSIELEDEVIVIPPNTELWLRSRAFIRADADNVFLDDHFEAVVLIGREYGRARYAVLKAYFNRDGSFVSEDRYSKYS